MLPQTKLSIEKEYSVLFIRAKGDAEYNGLCEYGYTVMDPYKGYSFFLRLLRETFFRLHLPLTDIWYNKETKNERFDNIIVDDPLITREYLLWLIAGHPKSRLFFNYGNLVGNARNLLPSAIPKEYSVWTYDKHDAEKYGLHLNDRIYLSPNALVIKEDAKYDVLFIGRDKGRYNYLQKLENELNAIGLKTNFHIVADGRYSVVKKKKYKPYLNYHEVLKNVSVTRAILNLVYEEQDGLSKRDMEAMANGIKLITNNRTIENKYFYYPENIFILGKDALSNLPAFLNKPFHPLPEEFIVSNSVHGWIELILSN